MHELTCIIKLKYDSDINTDRKLLRTRSRTDMRTDNTRTTHPVPTHDNKQSHIIVHILDPDVKRWGRKNAAHAHTKITTQPH